MIFGDVVVGDTGQPERWRDVTGVAITTFPIVSRFLDIKEARPVLDTVVGLDLRRSWPFGGHGPCRIQPSTMCDDQKTLADCGPTKLRRIIYGRVLFLMFHTFGRRNGH